MPPDFHDDLFAPCGMNCAVCYRHLGKRPCNGRLSKDAGKPASCQNCKLKSCAIEKGHSHCFACVAFPCKGIRALDRRYRSRYHVSLIQNSILERVFKPPNIPKKEGNGE